MERNAEMLSRMRYMTSITVFQLAGMGGIAFFVQRFKKLKSYARRLQTMFEVHYPEHHICTKTRLYLCDDGIVWKSP